MPDVDKPSYTILMVFNRYLPAVGGAELQARQLMLRLKQNGHNIEVVTRRLEDDWASTDTIDGIPVHRLSPVGLSTRASFFVLVHAFFYLLRYGRHAKVIHAHSVGPLALAALVAGRIIRRPVVLKAATHGDISRQTTASGGMPWATRIIRRWVFPFWLWRWMMSGVAAVIALSQETIQEAEQMGLGNRTILIPNGVDTERCRPPMSMTERQTIRDSLGVSPEAAMLVYSGRLAHRKRLDVLIDALAEIRADFPDIVLILAGSGDQQPDSSEAAIRALVAQHNLTDCVRFVGMIDDIPRYLRAADIYVFPSEREGMPNAVLEAMAAGLPVIACSIGGLIDIADEQTAWLVPPGDVSAFADAMRQALSQPQVAQAKGHAGRQRVLESFSLDATVAKYEALYQRLVDGPL